MVVVVSLERLEYRTVNSALGRSINLRYPTVRYALAASVLSGAVGLAIGLFADDRNAIRDGTSAGAAAFLAWAVGRELDPDRPLTAGLAAPLGLAIWLSGHTGLAAVGAALLAARIVVGTTGKSPRPGDLAVVVALAAYAGWRPGGVIAALALGLAVPADCALSKRRTPFRCSAGLFAMIGAAVTAIVWSDPLRFESPSVFWAVVGAVSLLAALFTPVPIPTSLADLTRQPLRRRRVLYGRGMTAAVVVGTFLLGGEKGLLIIGPLLAAMIATPAGFLLSKT